MRRRFTSTDVATDRRIEGSYLKSVSRRIEAVISRHTRDIQNFCLRCSSKMARKWSWIWEARRQCHFVPLSFDIGRERLMMKFVCACLLAVAPPENCGFVHSLSKEMSAFRANFGPTLCGIGVVILFAKWPKGQLLKSRPALKASCRKAVQPSLKTG